MSEPGENTDISSEEENLNSLTHNFIEDEIEKDLAEGVYDCVHTRFPPEGRSCGRT